MSVYLECQKQSIITSAAINQGMNQNADDAAVANVSDMYVSIFATNIRSEIRTVSSHCSDAASSVGTDESAVNACDKVSGYANELNSILGWAGSASKEIAATPGISETSVTSLGQTISSSYQYASQVINDAVSNVNESIQIIKNRGPEPGQEEPSVNKEAVAAAENVINQVEETNVQVSMQASSFTEQVEPDFGAEVDTTELDNMTDTTKVPPPGEEITPEGTTATTAIDAATTNVDIDTDVPPPGTTATGTTGTNITDIDTTVNIDTDIPPPGFESVPPITE